ncbi:hypothetical protein HUK80_02435 [Flavobacterium sp. MAH-1]|uniref:Uncharacterized protein n=1 Tax=Flavobacterium agri TaxID=2743471 RepID=A0A7Y8Y0L9_9FLAO|nr:hypothetical protein [Flavobacterium agri]NUY79738.1 hypothetical protein [Flavobacterium agri]NYA69763.1 hypothetical protein [Flavobacterium agri]
MNEDKLFELLFYCLPAAITAVTVYGVFNNFMKNDENKRRFALLRQNRQDSLPLKLQAYERMTLFLERIDPAKILIRVAPISDKKEDYANYVVAQIDQEFEHNLTQQIYMSDECWGVVVTAKNATVQLLRKYAAQAEVTDADNLREAVIKGSFDNPSPSTAALAYIRNEVRDLI